MNRQMYIYSCKIWILLPNLFSRIYSNLIKIYYFFLLFIFKDEKGFDKIFIKILIIIFLYNNNPSLSFIVTYI